MRLYTVHLRRHGLDADRDLEVVKEGFCWPAFLLSVLWALARRLWLAALVLLAVHLGFAAAVALAAPDPLSQGAATLGLAVIVGFVANDLRRWTLDRQGFVEVAVVSGADRDAAERRFLENRPELARELRR